MTPRGERERLLARPQLDEPPERDVERARGVDEDDARDDAPSTSSVSAASRSLRARWPLARATTAIAIVVAVGLCAAGAIGGAGATRGRRARGALGLGVGRAGGGARAGDASDDGADADAEDASLGAAIPISDMNERSFDRGLGTTSQFGEWLELERRKLRAAENVANADDIAWMVRASDVCNAGMDKTGLWVPRTMAERLGGDWLSMPTVDGDKWSKAARKTEDADEPARLKNSLTHREGMKFNACPSLIFIGDEYASDTWPSVVRQLGYAHGLRGATTSAKDTFSDVAKNPHGPNFVIGGGRDAPSFSRLEKIAKQRTDRDGVRLDKSDSMFLIASVREPLERVILAYLEHGVSQRGWRPTVENFDDFVFGRPGMERTAHVSNIQFKTLASGRLLNKTHSAETGQPIEKITDADVVSVLDAYDIVSTPEHELLSRLFLKHMLYRVVSVRQLLSPPEVGYRKLDVYGFKKFNVDDVDFLLPKALRDHTQSKAFLNRFNKLNALDKKLHAGANVRLLRMWKEHSGVTNYLEWREIVRAWVEPKITSSDEYKSANELAASAPRVADSCPIGAELECSNAFAARASTLLEEEKLRHFREQCLFENNGCFSRQIINLGLAHYKESRKTEGSSYLKEGDSTQSFGLARAALCADRAIVSNVRYCADNATMGSGVLGKSMIAMADAVYVLCARESCTTVCLPASWQAKARLIDGARVDNCLGSQDATHFRRATLAHGGIVAHARKLSFATIAVVEVDTEFVDPDSKQYPTYNAEQALVSVKDLLNDAAHTLDPLFTVIRVGYRPYEIELGAVSCPHGCGCRFSPQSEAVDEPLCVINRAQCDLRGSHAYIIGRDSYDLLLEPVLEKRAGDKVIDYNVLQRFPQQVILTPTLAVQSASSNGISFIDTATQLRTASEFARICAVR